MKAIFLSEGLRMLHYSFGKRILGVPRYRGDSREICNKIINKCWNGKYFRVSTGHFCEFYTRDFAWCTKALVRLGYKEKVHKTLGYAMGIFARNNMATTAISPAGKPFDFPNYAVDTMPYLVHSLSESEAYDLIEENRRFLQKELERFFGIVLDKTTGLVRGMHFSSAKDHSLRRISCYDIAMLGMLSKDLDRIGLSNPLSKFDYEHLLKERYWKKGAFVDELGGTTVSGDANVFPYWCGIIKDRSMLKSSIERLRELQLDKPFPLKYTEKPQKAKALDFFTPNYQGNAIWSYLGMLYIDLVSRVDERLALYYLVKYGRRIEYDQNFLEVFSPEGEPYKTAFYLTDDSMIWASLFLDLVRKLQ